jgi:hypothetical protein
MLVIVVVHMVVGLSIAVTMARSGRADDRA